MNPDQVIKIIVVGDQGVGKTCMLQQYSSKRFDETSAPTIGCDFVSKIIDFQGRSVSLQLWDLAGQDRFHSATKIYIRGALGCLVVCDVLNEKSIDSTIKWKAIVDENCDRIEEQTIPMLLVQNKADEIKKMGRLEKFQTPEFLKEFAQQNKFLECFQVSAKENFGLEETFECLVKRIQIFAKSVPNTKENNFESPNIKLQKPPSSESKGSSTKKKKNEKCC